MANKGGRQKELEAREQQRRLSKAELLRPHLAEKDVYISELDGTVRIRSLSHKQRKELQEKAGFNTPEYDDDKMTMFGIIESVIDPQLTETDVEAFREQGSGIIDQLSMEISLLNMIGGSKELGEESSPTQNSDSDSN